MPVISVYGQDNYTHFLIRSFDGIGPSNTMYSASKQFTLSLNEVSMNWLVFNVVSNQYQLRNIGVWHGSDASFVRVLSFGQLELFGVIFRMWTRCS